jgi:hypothetical protein
MKKLFQGSLWKQEAGNWKMFRDIWTSDLPPSDIIIEQRPALKKE